MNTEKKLLKMFNDNKKKSKATVKPKRTKKKSL